MPVGVRRQHSQLGANAFIAEYDVDSNASVVPGSEREFHLKPPKSF
jgi:hypothetical protein